MTTTLQTEPTSAQEILDAATALAPAVAARAAEIEAARTLPADLVEDLSTAGCFRLLVPQSHGGVGASAVDALEVYEALSRADASVGWTTMIGSGGWRDLVGLPRATFDALYRSGPDVPIAGVFNPTGVAVPVEGGYRVSGRWAFASGCIHSSWVYGNCQEETEDGPRLRTVLFAPDEVQIEDTWHVVGLCGTGSHHVTADNVVVPSERTCATFEDEPCVRAPIVGIQMPSLIAMGVAAVALGVARGALDDISAAAEARTPLLAGSPLAGNPLFRRDLAGADTELRAAGALLHQVGDEAWAAASSETEVDLDLRARIRATAVWAVDRAVGVVRTAYQAGGSSAIYRDSPLQRRLRDIHALAQHFLVRPDTMITAGAVMVGQDPDVPVF